MNMFELGGENQVRLQRILPHLLFCQNFLVMKKVAKRRQLGAFGGGVRVGVIVDSPFCLYLVTHAALLEATY